MMQETINALRERYPKAVLTVRLYHTPDKPPFDEELSNEWIEWMKTAPLTISRFWIQLDIPDYDEKGKAEFADWSFSSDNDLEAKIESVCKYALENQ